MVVGSLVTVLSDTPFDRSPTRIGVVIKFHEFAGIMWSLVYCPWTTYKKLWYRDGEVVMLA